MSALKQEIYNLIDDLPENKLLVLKPLLSMIVDDTVAIETDLTEEEKGLIAQGMKEYNANPAAATSWDEFKG